MTDDRRDQNMLSNATEIIQRFGGIRPMASKMEIPVTTVQGWKKRNAIPGNRRDQVLEAARNNGIDLSDLMSAVANENVTAFPSPSPAAPAPSFSAPSSSVPPVSAPPQQAPVVDQDVFMKKIQAAEKRAVRKSTWMSALLVCASMAFAGWLLWPEKQKIDEHGSRIAALETDVGEVAKKQTFLQGLIPDNFEEKLSAIQDHVGDMVDRAEEIAGTVLGEDAGTVADRLTKLEQQVKDMTGSPELSAWMEKIRAMQQTPEGRDMLAGSVASLNAAIDGGNGMPVDAALEQAQQQDQALGGVSSADLKAAALLLGLTQLRSAAGRSEPFAQDLVLLRKMLGGNDPELDAAIEKLAPQAASGVLTPAGLSAELKGMAGDIVAASLEGRQETLKDMAMARLNGVLQIRKDGEMIAGDDTQEKIAQAQDMLDGGDVAGALVILQSLDGPAAQTAQPVIGRMQATVLTQQVEDMLTRNVMEILTRSTISGTTSVGGIEGLTRELHEMVGVQGAPMPSMPGTEKPLYLPQN